MQASFLVARVGHIFKHTKRAISRMVNTALHKGQVTFLQLNPTSGRLNCSINTSLDCSEVGAGSQDPNNSTREQVSRNQEGSEESSIVPSDSRCPVTNVCLQPL